MCLYLPPFSIGLPLQEPREANQLRLEAGLTHGGRGTALPLPQTPETPDSLLEVWPKRLMNTQECKWADHPSQNI